MKIEVIRENSVYVVQAEAGSSLLHDITKAAARLCVLVCNPFARERWYIFF